jgi:MFS family permease
MEPTGRLATSVGLPELTGLFMTSIVAFALSGLVLTIFLRPDPLKVATGRPIEDRVAAPAVPLRELLSPAAAVTGLTTVVVANFVMVAVMAMAPVHMHHNGHGLQFVGLVISLHVAGMFAPSPITGWLTDRLGPLAVAGGGAALLIVAGILSAASGAQASTFALGLGLLGVGWNASLIAGSALLASAVPVAQRPRVEGAGELSMGVAAASATAIAGPVVGVAGYAALAAAGAVAAATLAPFLVAVARRGLPADVVPATRVLG